MKSIDTNNYSVKAKHKNYYTKKNLGKVQYFYDGKHSATLQRYLLTMDNCGYI